VFFLLSILGGAVVLRWLLVRQFARAQAEAQSSTPLPRRQRRVSYGRAAAAMLLAAIAGAFAAGALFALFHNIARTVEPTPAWPYLVGGVLAVIALVGVAYLVLLTMFPLSPGRVLRAAAPTFAMILVLAVIIGTPTALMARANYLTELHQAFTVRRNLPRIDEALRAYEVRYNVPAPTLSALVEAELIQPGYLRSPADEDREIGYFYMPKRSALADLDTREIRVCDYRTTFEGQGRGVLFVNGATRWAPPAEFQRLLQLEVNQDFARRLRAEEGN
jgi:hypothetical protein